MEVTRPTLQLHASDGAVSLTLVLDSAMNYALAHNGISPLQELVIENRGDQPLRGMSFELELTGPVSGRIADPLRSSLPEVEPNTTAVLPARGVRWSFD